MLNLQSKNIRRQHVHRRVRSRVRGVKSIPRLNVYRSLNHIYAQIVDDSEGRTLVSASSVDREVSKALKAGGNVAAAKQVGQTLAERAKAKGIDRIIFDRGGYAYQGRVKALAEAARAGGLKF
jgi:large subunit ribosomal protein L18